MKLSLQAADANLSRAHLVAIPVVEGSGVAAPGLERGLRRKLEALRAGVDFAGKRGKSVALAAPAGLGKIVLFVGLGKNTDTLEMARRLGGIALGKCSDLGATRLIVVPPHVNGDIAFAVSEGLLLADYEFIRHKTSGAKASKAKGKKSPAKPEVLASLILTSEARTSVRSELPLLEALASGVKLARDLGNEPSNILTPAALAAAAVDIARLHAKDGVSCKVLGLKEIEKLGMGSFLAVAKGSREEPKLIHLTYKPPVSRGKDRGVARRVVLIGKGLCFDSGGISIKPAASMEDMKFDMCGAAAVLGVFRSLPGLGIAHEVHGIVAATENMPGGAAVKPGDIVKSMAGRTIEVINTDAEGRLTLVDALTYSLQCKPEVIVDLATLTGACAVALGEASGIMSNDDGLREALCRSSDATGERAWPLPLFDDYKSQLRSDYADVKNLGDRYGGALTAGLFIQEWVPEGMPWAHMDIAGSAWVGKAHAYGPTGATGIGVRTLAHWLKSL